MTFELKRLSTAHWVQCASALLLTVSLALGNALFGKVIQVALGGSRTDSSNLGDFINACDNLLKPLFSVMLAVTPLVVIGGAAMIALGNSRGQRIIVTSLFALILVACARTFAH